MKLTFECKLTMYDCIHDDELERVYTKEKVAEFLAKYIKDGLTESGGVSITDVTLTKEDGEQDG